MQVPDRLLGRRVALRHAVGVRDGRELFSDAVGELAEDGPETLVVHTRRGPVRIVRSAVVAVRAVPQAPPRRAPLAAIVRLETLCADARPAAVEERLGGWRLRAGSTGPAVSSGEAAVALGDPGRPIAEALQLVEEFAAAHGIAAVVRVPAGSPWDRAVAGAGWTAAPPVTVLVAALTGDDGPPVGPAGAVVVEDHLYLGPPAGPSQLATAAAWGRSRGARWAVTELPSDDQAATELATRLGFTEHHRAHRYACPIA